MKDWPSIVGARPWASQTSDHEVPQLHRRLTVSKREWRSCEMLLLESCSESQGSRVLRAAGEAACGLKWPVIRAGPSTVTDWQPVCLAVMLQANPIHTLGDSLRDLPSTLHSSLRAPGSLRRRVAAGSALQAVFSCSFWLLQPGGRRR